MPLEMISRRPDFAIEFLSWAIDGRFDNGYQEIREESIDLSDRLPTEYRADSVISARPRHGRRRHFMITEVQSDFKEDKVWAWAGYTGTLMAKHKSVVYLHVFCLSRLVAEKYRSREIIPRGSSLILRPYFTCPEDLPPILDPAQVRRYPEFATLSAAAAPQDFDRAASVALTLAEFDDDRSQPYYDYLRGRLPEQDRERLEDMMIESAPRLPDRFTQPLEDAAEARGEARGEARHAARMLFKMLNERGLEVTEEQRETIRSCADVDQLDAWVYRAVTATTTAEVFAGPA
jgi:hypothetical protein